MCYHIGQRRGRVFSSSQSFRGSAVLEGAGEVPELGKLLQEDQDTQRPLCIAQAFDLCPPDSSLLRHMWTHSYDSNNHRE